MWEQLRPLLGRLLGVVVPVVLVRLFAWLGVPMPPELPGIVTDVCLVLSMYFVTHRLVNKRLNPGDAASATIARVEIAEKASLRAADRVRPPHARPPREDA